MSLTQQIATHPEHLRTEFHAGLVKWAGVPLRSQCWMLVSAPTSIIPCVSICASKASQVPAIWTRQLATRTRYGQEQKNKMGQYNKNTSLEN